MIAAYTDYINASLAKGTIGAYISVGIFALLGVFALLGIYFGARRGFSKSVIRIFTVGASAALSLWIVKAILSGIVDNAPNYTDNGSSSLEDLISAYAPDLLDSLPDMVRPILAEVNSGTATVFVMMILAVVISPILFIVLFNLLRFLTMFIYKLLAGLIGAISYGKGVFSTIFGAVVGLLQGVLIAGIMVFPISGLCGVATDARVHLMENTDTPNEYISQAYTTVIDDLADNPLFAIVDGIGGEGLYRDMITVKIDGEKMYMGERCVGAVKVVADLMPVVTPGFDWAHPTDAQRQALADVVVDVSNDELIAKLVSDLVRGAAVSYKKGNFDFGLTGATQQLIDDAMSMFLTTTHETVEGDLDVVLDIYFIMCDRDIIDSFTAGHHLDMRELLTDKDENGNTTSSIIIKRLNEYDRARHIVTSFTKITLAVMHGSQDFGAEAEELYQNVKTDVSSALAHNKSDFDTEEEYREAVSNDLDAALANNNIQIEENVKEDMIDYIAENYGDYDGEITDAEINDALLSYYESHSKHKEAESGSEGGTDGDVGGDE